MAKDQLVQGRKRMAIWLFAVCGLLVVMILLGGLTRLTDSGLSITEWKPISGALPPFTTEHWEEEFEKYQQIPEFHLINADMTLDEFKTIYWWEWSHRFLGRFIGLAFLLPALYFYFTGQMERRLVPKFAVMFLLGGLQGALGWYMVASGLVDRVDVSQYRLAAHLLLAVLILSYIFWSALDLYFGEPVHQGQQDHALRGNATVLLLLVWGQIFLGALVAGLHAGKTYNTWPLMDGDIVPEGLFSADPWWINFFENITTVQFDHRIVAYILLAWCFVLWWQSNRLALGDTVRRSLYFVWMCVAGQIVLGIWTLLEVVPLALASLHQFGAIIVLGASVYFLNRIPRQV